MMGARIMVDEEIPEGRRALIIDAVRRALNERADDDSLFALVSRLPDGRLRVYVNHVEEPTFVAALEDELAKLR